jgi:biofilm PGA synthesis lipoprotein PgaB
MALLKPFLRCFCLGLALLSSPCVAAEYSDPARFTALCYHEIEPEGAPLSATALREQDLAAQFAWLQANAYQPVNLTQIVAARAGGPPLPAKAVLLTFDDGRQDFFSRVYPLLKRYHYPAIAALVSEWLAVPAGKMVDYDGRPQKRSDFLSWSEIREMRASGLVEFANHTHDLHRAIPSNPQDNLQPATTTRRYENGQYEDDAAYLARLRHGLADQVLKEHLGAMPRSVVWPYGRNNGASRALAAELGMSIGFTLEDGDNDSRTPLWAVKRQLIENSPTLQEFAQLLRRNWQPDPARSVRLDPADWSDLEQGLSNALDQLLSLAPNIAFIRPAVLRDGQEYALFPTAQRPLAADYLNRISWQIERRAGVPVFIDVPNAWLNNPALLGDLARQVNFAGLRLAAAPDDPRIFALRQTVDRWRWPVQLAFALQETPSLATFAALPAGDLIILPAPAERPPDELKAYADRLLFEFDPARPAADLRRAMQALEAAGFRQFGLGGFPAANLPLIAPALSLRSQPQLP